MSTTQHVRGNGTNGRFDPRTGQVRPGPLALTACGIYVRPEQAGPVRGSTCRDCWESLAVSPASNLVVAPDPDRVERIRAIATA